MLSVPFPLSFPSQAEGHCGPLTVLPGNCQTKEMWPPSVLVGGGCPQADRRLAEDLAEQMNVVFPRVMDGVWFIWCSVTVGSRCVLWWEDEGEGLSPLAVC